MKPSLNRTWISFKIGLLPSVYILMLLVILILPFYSVGDYSILKNTTSHLGAQGAPWAWVMNVVFALLGIATILDGFARLSKYWLHKVVLAIFGISLILTAFFQHAPIVQGVAFSAFEDDLHSKFATITGFSFIFFAIAAAFIEPSRLRKVIAVGVGMLAMLLSLLIFKVADLAGIWQRTMFILTFAWLMYFLFLRSRTSHRSN